MARNVIADAGFLGALLHPRDAHHQWAAAIGRLNPAPWLTSESALTEAFFLLRPRGLVPLAALMRRGAIRIALSLEDEGDRVLALMEKYADVPMSLADACLVRLTETLPDPLVLTTDADFRVYRRNGREVVPCVFPE